MAVDFKANFFRTRNTVMVDLTGLMVAIILVILRMECFMDKVSIISQTSRRHTKDLLKMESYKVKVERFGRTAASI
jgi:hypothetical protein